MRVNHFIGGVLLVAGTTIGAGMLALPVTTGFVGFVPSLVIFAICWLVMLFTAFCFLDVNLAVKGEPNLISMTQKTLGTWGKAFAWVVYLLLLYSLVAAYIAGSGTIFIAGIKALTGYTLPDRIAPFCLPLLFGFFVYLGTLGVDIINRILIIGLGASYLILLLFLPECIDQELLTHVDFGPSLIAFPVLITSFGYHIIIPTLTTYMNHDRKLLKQTLIVGSLLPLAFYIVWQIAILGIVPLEGPVSLAHSWLAGEKATTPLIAIVHSPWIRIGAQFFAFFAIITSFLGVSLSLSDFLTDGLKIKKTWEGRLIAIALVFVPPLLFVFAYERGFMAALQYAGAFVALLLIFLPAVMAWQLKTRKFYRSPLGRFLLIAAMAFAFFIVSIDVLDHWGLSQRLVAKYVQVSH